MPFLAEEHIAIPNKDLLSWIFDDQKYDEEKAVSCQTSFGMFITVLVASNVPFRSISTQGSPLGRYAHAKLDL